MFLVSDWAIVFFVVDWAIVVLVGGWAIVFLVIGWAIVFFCERMRRPCCFLWVIGRSCFFCDWAIVFLWVIGRSCFFLDWVIVLFGEGIGDRVYGEMGDWAIASINYPKNHITSLQVVDQR